MTNRRLAPFLLVLPLLAGLMASCRPGIVRPAWVQRSDQHARVLLDLVARFHPEMAAHLGVEGVDGDVVDLRPGFVERKLRARDVAKRALDALIATEKDPRVVQDLQIMSKLASDMRRMDELDERLVLGYPDLAQLIFGGMRGLLNTQVVAKRHAAAATRLRRYAGAEAGYTPISELAMAYVRGRIKLANLRPPAKSQMLRDLASADQLIEGIRRLCQRFKVAGHEAPFATLKQQLGGYYKFLRAELLPLAKDDFRLPPELYEMRLSRFGVDLKPADIAAKARAAYATLQGEMQAVAAKLAGPGADYRAVLKKLKERQLVGAAILPHYQQRLAALEAIIKTNKLVSLPGRAARIRLATAAESAALPAPHMRPPRLIGNQGELGTFILPLNVPPPPGVPQGKALVLDDFTFEAASWTLTAHEARPGHEMQFAAMVENGVSTARAVFAFNSTNVEGWGLYAEAIALPYLPLDGQLVSLQHRLLRAARAYIDPELQLGKLTPEDALRILREDVVLSEGMARSEVERYTFRAPGQAVSYFYGYLRLSSLRREVEQALGARFDAAAFHDFILAQGLLPPDLLRAAVLERFQ